MSIAETEGSCPNGGDWFTCQDQSPTFLGCCTSNPCNGIGCPSSDLRAAGLGIGRGPDLPQNDSSYFPNVQCVTGQWWTCALQSPTFQGCCDSNPCGGDNTGCPSDSLHAAAFASTPATLKEWPATNAPSSSSAPTSTLDSNSVTSTKTSQTSSSRSSSVASTPTSSSSSSSASSTSLPTSLPNLPAVTGSKSSSNTAAVAGGAAGGVAFLVILGLLYWLYRRQKRLKALHPNTTIDGDLTHTDVTDQGHFMGGKAVKGDKYQRYHPDSTGFLYTKAPLSPGSTDPGASPGPPPYPSNTPNPNEGHIHEIDSHDPHGISEMGVGNALGIQQLDGRAIPEAGPVRINSSYTADSGNGHGYDDSMNVPASPTSPNGPVQRNPMGMESPDLGVEGERRAGRENYTSWQSYS